MGMGMSGSDMAMLIGMLGGSAISGMTAPQGQKLTSFSGTGQTDPRNMLFQGKGMVEDYLGSLVDNAAEPTTIHTTVAPVAGFHGGPLPMALGLNAQDPNRLNPDLRTTPGFQMSKRRLGDGAQADAPPVPGDRFPPGAGGAGSGGGAPTDTNGVPTGGVAVPRGTAGLAPGQTFTQDDAHRAAAALNLMLLRPTGTGA